LLLEALVVVARLANPMGFVDAAAPNPLPNPVLVGA